MDDREPARTAPTEGPTPPRRPVVRRLPRNRLALTAFGVAGLAVSLAVAGSLLWGQAVRYIHAQPAYRLTFREITLEPPPPAWYRGGAAAFLDRVAAGSNHPRDLSSLDLDLKRLTVVFQRYPWVERVLGVATVGRNRVTVRLVYREPVAVSRSPGGPETFIDHEVYQGRDQAVILPRDDIDPAAAGPLIELHRFPPPADPHPGEVWNRADANQGTPAVDDRVASAARLAAFLRRQLIADASLARQIPSVYIDLWGERGLAVEVGDQLFRWKAPDEGEMAGALSDEAKWAMLRDWVGTHPPSAGGGRVDDLEFTKRGVVRHPPLPRPRDGSDRGPGGSAGRLSR